MLLRWDLTQKNKNKRRSKVSGTAGIPGKRGELRWLLCSGPLCRGAAASVPADGGNGEWEGGCGSQLKQRLLLSVMIFRYSSDLGGQQQV